MKAVVFEDVGSVAVREIADARIEEADDALIRVSVAGICGSDLHFLHGKAPMSPGETIGHEAVGVVEAIGSSVETFAPGDRVVVAFNIACGECWFCERGETQLCENFRNLGAGAFGGSLGGAQAELLRVPTADFNLLRVPDGVEDEVALFAGDVFTTGMFATAACRVSAGHAVGVVGAGPVGNAIAQAALLRGAASVIAFDRETDRLALAERAGATAVDVTERHPQMVAAEHTGDRGLDVVFEAVGAPAALETAIDVVRRGGTVGVVGIYAGEEVPLPLGVLWSRAIDLRFTGICPVHAWWEETMEGLESGALDPRPLVSHRLPFAEAMEGYALFDAHEATKVLLCP
ncbi:MAG: alcohol dehydrogenase catalytic domain-containing protein [Actinomycetota bacterium]